MVNAAAPMTIFAGGGVRRAAEEATHAPTDSPGNAPGLPSRQEGPRVPAVKPHPHSQPAHDHSPPLRRDPSLDLADGIEGGQAARASASSQQAQAAQQARNMPSMASRVDYARPERKAPRLCQRAAPARIAIKRKTAVLPRLMAGYIPLGFGTGRMWSGRPAMLGPVVDQAGNGARRPEGHAVQEIAVHEQGADMAAFWHRISAPRWW